MGGLGLLVGSEFWPDPVGFNWLVFSMGIVSVSYKERNFGNL